MDLTSSHENDSDSSLQEDPGEREAIDESDCKPKDLSIKPNMKRMKPIPPPLNLRADNSVEVTGGISTALKEFAILATGPRSPLMQKNLPFRKRAHSVPEVVEDSPHSAPPLILKSFQIPIKDETPYEEDPPLNLSLPATPSSRTCSMDLASHSAGSSSHPASPRPIMSTLSTEIPHPSVMHQAYPRHYGQSWSPFHPQWLSNPPSALLSPAPSSLGSSQEDLRMVATQSMSGMSVIPGAIMPHITCETLPWPHPVWHCFQPGTLIRLTMGGSELSLRAEEWSRHSELKTLTPERLGPLRVQYIERLDAVSAVDITFSCAMPSSLSLPSDLKLVATCHPHHTFFIYEKRWCAVSPDAVLQIYGAKCLPLECGDCCLLPPKLPQVSSPGICDKFKRFSFSPEELNPPHHQQLGQQLGTFLLSPPHTPTQKCQQHHQQQQSQPQQQQQQRHLPPPAPTAAQALKQPKATKQKQSSQKVLDPDRPKRPMNAFMLFAKQHRLKLIQMHPGKDNRFVSVILGEAWKQLPAEEKEVFITEAKALSHERKRLHPECWKRKRSHSTS